MSALCVTSHLTLFAVEDSSEAAQLVADKIAAISAAFGAISDVDLGDDDTEINPVVPAAFAAATLAFFVVVVVHKCRTSMRAKNKKADRAQVEARRVFLQDGELARPGVIRSEE